MTSLPIYHLPFWFFMCVRMFFSPPQSSIANNWMNASFFFFVFDFLQSYFWLVWTFSQSFCTPYRQLIGVSLQPKESIRDKQQWQQLFSIWMELKNKIKCKLLWNLCKVCIFPYAFSFPYKILCNFSFKFCFCCGFVMCAFNYMVHNIKWRWVY